MLALVIVFVPRREIKKLFWFSLLWGSMVDFLLVELFRLLNFYRYENSFPLEFYGSPIMLNLAWSQAIILFIHFLPRRKEWYVLPFYIAMFSMIGTAIGVFFKNAGLIREIHWNELLRFPVWVVWFYGVCWHYNRLRARDRTTI
ncbi:MAG TPA: hypothetical protein VF531_10955 [Bacillota bacterium]